MRCEEVIDLMNRELDEDLTEEEQETLHQHLLACSDCKELFSRLQAVSSQLHALPKVTPPLRIVDSILPTLEELDKQNAAHDQMEQDLPLTPIPPEKDQGNKHRRLWAKKHWWIPSSVVAAGLLAVYLSSMAPFSSTNDSTSESGEGYTQELALDMAQDNGVQQKFAGEESTFDAASDKEHEITTNRAGGNEQMGSLMFGADDDGTDGVHAKHPIIPSPNGEYYAQPGYEGMDIRINLKSDDPHYMTKTNWEKPWEIYSMEWVSNEQFYFVLFNPKTNAYQYWLINAEERTEEQLEEPYQH